MKVLLLLTLYWSIVFGVGTLIFVKLYYMGARSRWWLFASFLIPIGLGSVVVATSFAPTSLLRVGLSFHTIDGHIGHFVIYLASVSVGTMIAMGILLPFTSDGQGQWRKSSGRPMVASVEEPELSRFRLAVGKMLRVSPEEMRLRIAFQRKRSMRSHK